MKYTVENGAFACKHGKGGAYAFTPRGKHKFYGRNPVKAVVYGVPDNAARMFIGFSVGDTPTWHVDDLAALFRSLRSNQRNDAGKLMPLDASFVIQKGLYTHGGEVGGKLIYENSCQLIVLGLYGESEPVFIQNMQEVAGNIARHFKQETVILEIQRNGAPIEVFGVSWED